MAESRESTILDVKLDAGKVAQDLQDLITRIAALKAQQKSLNEEIKAGNDVDGKYAEQLIRVKDQLAWTEKQAKGLSATTKLLNADTLTYSDSLNGERQKLADMQKAYDQLDRAQRESEGGKAFLEAIKAQSDAVKGLEEDTGRAQRNVGNYSGAINKAFDNIGQAANDLNPAKDVLSKFGPEGQKAAAALDLLGKVMKAAATYGKVMKATQQAQTVATQAQTGAQLGLNAAMEANPIGLIIAAITALISIVQKLISIFSDASSQTEKFNKALEVNAELIEQTQKVADFEARMAAAVGKSQAEQIEIRRKAAEEAVALADAEVKKLEDIQKNGSRKERKAAKEVMEQALQQQKDAYDALRKLNEDATVQAAADNYKAEQDKLKAQEEANKRYIEKQKQLQKEREAAEKEREAAEKERRKNAEEIAKQAEDFAISLIEDETARTIAQRKIQGEREIAALQERLDKEKNLTEESRAQLAELIKGKQAALDAELEQMATDAANALTEEQVKAEEERAMRILEYKRELAESGSEEELAIQKEILDAQMAQELENVELSEEEKYLIRETFAKKAEELDKQYHDNLVKQAQDARAAYKESLKATAASASQTFGAMSDLLSAYGEENEAAAKASKAFGIAQIITDQAISIADTAKAISAAVAGATAAAASTGPAAPFVLAGYIAAMVGAVLGALGSIASTIAQAKQLMSSADTAKDAGKYAGGGTVPGTSYTGDKLIAHVNSGEGIYTGTQANNLLQEIANNPLRGGASEEMAAAMAAAVSALPAPVMVLQEFREFEQKVSTFDELAKI